jgi:hypothetical protein
LRTAKTKKTTAHSAPRRRQVYAYCLLAMILMLIEGVKLGAQVDSASLSGVVQDQSGAIISGATVTVQNTTTGITRTSASNGSGLFAFEAIPSGDYTLTVEQTGFKKLVRTIIHLNHSCPRQHFL